MSYVTGVANDFAALKAALVNACTASGWTLNGNVLHKGACFVELLTTGNAFTVKGGTGIGGGNVLDGPAAEAGRMGLLGSNNVIFPATYHVHVLASPDEVFLLVNYNVDFWQWLAFGASDVPGLPGTGCWFGAPWPELSAKSSVYLTPNAAGSFFGASGNASLFLDTDSVNPDLQVNCSIHHDFEGEGWSKRGRTLGGAQALAAAAPKYARQPNAWNAASALINYQVYVRRIDDKQSLAADLGHARLLRLDNMQPGDVITLGADKWKAYPWYRRNTSERDGAAFVQHSGTMGWAIRYDGP